MRFEDKFIENLDFGRSGLNSSIFEKLFISYSCIFISYIQCFEVSFQKFRFFLWKAVFPEFWLIQSNFWSIEILFRNFSEPLPGSIDRTCFSINRTSWIQFLKNSVLTDSNYFFKTFSTFSLSLSLRLGKATQRFFVVFFLNFCKVFLPQGR